VYCAVADFRTPSLQWYTFDLALGVDEASDAQLTSAIAGMTELVDAKTYDHFEPESSLSIDVESVGGAVLYSPKRIRALTKVETRDATGNLTTELTTSYRVTGSLLSGSRDPTDRDVLTIVPGNVLASGATTWPVGPQAVRLTGDFSWSTTPERIKRLVALLVWDHFKNWNPDQRRARRYTSPDGSSYDYDPTTDTGIPEADNILKDFKRAVPLASHR
jgi:hypothetical protein